MSSEAPSIVARLWNYCHVLRDEGVSYGDYVEQLTYLLFLKMAEERVEYLFQRYEQLTAPLAITPLPKRKRKPKP